MKQVKVFFLTGVAALLLSAASSHALLIDRGGGLIYDSVLDITWMQDASYIQSSASVEKMSWTDAMAWVEELEYYDSVRGVTWTDWRLPTTVNDPSSLGYDVSGTSSELAYMYYTNLGYEPNYTHDRFDPSPVSDDYNPFINLNYRGYWSETILDDSSLRAQAWYVHFHFGSQELDSVNTGQRVWAVRNGDVNPVHEPSTLVIFLLGSCLVVLRIACQRRT